MTLPELDDDDVAAPLAGVDAGFDSAVEDFSGAFFGDFSDESELLVLFSEVCAARESLR